MKWTGYLMMAGLLIAGCGKKDAEPESAGTAAKVEFALKDVGFTRVDAEGSMERNRAEVGLKITNNFDAPITVAQVDYATTVGTHDFGEKSLEPNAEIPAGQTRVVPLQFSFGWKDDAPLPKGAANVTGTVYWVGPAGGRNATPFEVSGAAAESE